MAGANILCIGNPDENVADRTYSTMVSGRLNEADRRVVPFRPRTAVSRRNYHGKARIPHSGPDYSPVPDLSKYERSESADDYRQRMIENAAALVFVIVLILTGSWLVISLAQS